MKFFYNLLFLFLTVSAFAQNQLWKGYFSYNEVKAITSSSSKTYFATTNAVFVWTDASEEIEIYNSINGFKAQDITAIAHSANFSKIIVGNSNGQLAIIDENSGKVNFLNDIVNKTSIPENLKAINDIYVNENTAYVATKYGISSIRLNDNNFGDTYYIGDAGEFSSVLQCTVINNYIYAATELFGLKRISITNPNLIDYAQWETYSHAKWLSIVNLKGSLVGVKDDLSLNRFENNAPIAVANVYAGFYKLNVHDAELTAVTHESVRCYNQHLSLQFEYNFNTETGRFNTALVKNNKFFLGTKENGAFLINPSQNTKTIVSPNGPSKNTPFRIMENNSNLYVIYGGHKENYLPVPEKNKIDKYELTKGWKSIPVSNLNDVQSTSYISINPRNPDKLYVSSFNNGLLEITPNSNDFSQSTSTLFNETNSGLGYVFNGVMNSVRINGPEFDGNGVGWIMNSFVNNSIRSFDLNGNWKTYSLASVLTSEAGEKYLAPIIDRNNTKWIATNNSGVIGFNETKNNKIIRIGSGENSGNLPGPHVNTIDLDTSKQLWIGTNNGLRVLNSVDQFLTSSSLKANEIIITEEGKAQELFYQQQVLKIKVDGANNKWISIGGSGVFLVTPNGQEIIYKFTTENSPLPSNNVFDIAIDGKSGEVFFATEKGIVSFKNFATEAGENLDEVKVFPNPVRPDYTGEVKITGLVAGSNVKITDVAGNLVFEQKSQGGTVLWNTYNFSGQKVVSGVYMIFIASDEATETTVKKVMIIR